MLENDKSNSVFHGGTTEQKEPFEEENNRLIEQTVPKKRNVLSEEGTNKTNGTDTPEMEKRIAEFLNNQKSQNNKELGTEKRTHSCYYKFMVKDTTSSRVFFQLVA